MVHEIISLTELNPSVPITVLDFYATWCGPCKRIAPAFMELADSFPNVQFAKVNVDDAQALANQFNISSIPTFIVLLDGALFARIEGANIAGVRAAVTKAIATLKAEDHIGNMVR